MDHTQTKFHNVIFPAKNDSRIQLFSLPFFRLLFALESYETEEGEVKHQRIAISKEKNIFDQTNKHERFQ